MEFASQVSQIVHRYYLENFLLFESDAKFLGIFTRKAIDFRKFPATFRAEFKNIEAGRRNITHFQHQCSTNVPPMCINHRKRQNAFI